jgi:hypothetical protein
LGSNGHSDVSADLPFGFRVSSRLADLRFFRRSRCDGQDSKMDGSVLQNPAHKTLNTDFAMSRPIVVYRVHARLLRIEGALRPNSRHSRAERNRPQHHKRTNGLNLCLRRGSDFDLSPEFDDATDWNLIKFRRRQRIPVDELEDVYFHAAPFRRRERQSPDVQLRMLFQPY